MNGIETLLESRSSLLIAAFAVSWLATALIALVAANLHVRLAHLERTMAIDARRRPYGHLLGKHVEDLEAGDFVPGSIRGPRAILVLARDCSACDRVLDELGRRRDRWPVSLAWRHASAASPPSRPLPEGVDVLAGGSRLAEALGVSVSPFAVVLDDAGKIAAAAPTTSWTHVRALITEAGIVAPEDDRGMQLDQPSPLGASS